MQSSGFILLAYVRDRMTGRNLPEMRPASTARTGLVRLSTGISAHRAMILSAAPPYRMEMQRRSARELVKLNSISPPSTSSSAHEKKHSNTSRRQQTFVLLVELSSSRCEPLMQTSSRIGESRLR